RFNPGTGFADNMHGEIAIVGSGLTALDAVALLDEQGFSGRLHLVSRHGLLPCIENPFAHALDLDALALDTQTPYALLRSLRAAARRHCEAGGDWRDVVESIRSISPDVWSAWSLRERRRFLRHVQPFWAIHRYRVPPQTAAVCSRLRREGRLVRHRGRIDEASETADGRLRVRIVHATGITSLVVSGAINCTGPNGDYTRVRHPLVQNLLRRGIIRPDVLSLGMDATTDLRVIDREGRRNERLFTLGPPLRGLRYETTAVPETREQAALVARWIVEALPEQRLEAAS
ncbi:MAG TPA: hypothetical protein VNG31_04110, partial [Candidatus Baltobacteraceae bacterium]|nr:hypothetical protein [Candidatus Baltobacteraceae bacterium]